MKTFFTSDLHFGHEKIIKYCYRPFKTAKEMDETLIKNFNARITPHDIVIHLGDFCSKRCDVNKYLERINGHWVFVQGNHDINRGINTKITALELNINGKEIYCTHIPNNYHEGFEINLVGHVHSLWTIKQTENLNFLVNCGVDVWNYRPITMDEILKKIDKFKKGEL